MLSLLPLKIFRALNSLVRRKDLKEDSRADPRVRLLVAHNRNNSPAAKVLKPVGQADFLLVNLEGPNLEGQAEEKLGQYALKY